MKLINIGFNNIVVADKIVAVVSADGAPSKRLIDVARKGNKLIDATAGRKTRTIVVMRDDQVLLSGVAPETLAARIGEA